MSHGIVIRSAALAVGRVPGVRRIPVLKLVAAAEVAMLAHNHLMRLDRTERRRLFELVRIGRGRRRNLTEAEGDELAGLVAKTEPRLLAGLAADKFSPVPLPRRFVRGPRAG
jgi:hypothetical protein